MVNFDFLPQNQLASCPFKTQKNNRGSRSRAAGGAVGSARGVRAARGSSSKSPCLNESNPGLFGLFRF